MAERILLIEDDLKLQRLLGEYLGAFGYELHAEAHPEQGLAALGRLRPDLVILDVMLPGMNGFEVCRRIRRDSGVSVIMLTARGDVMDRVAGLELGADDYMAKPFEPRELLARVQSVLRRSGSGAQRGTAGSGAGARAGFGRLVVDHGAHDALLDGRPVGLTTNEFNALAVLVRQPGQVVEREALIFELRGLEAESFNRSVDITMSRLRQKLGDNPRAPEFIKTVWGAGYMFIAPSGGGASPIQGEDGEDGEDGAADG
ncbi:MAG: response regulator transcription factor [Desulfovibrionaceae bacterium]